VTACLCLTPLRAAFDPHYQTGYLAMHGNAPLRRMLLGALAPGFRMVDRAAWRRYAHAFAISREVKTRIVLGGLRPRNPAIEMAYPGVDADALVPSWRYDSYFLLPGRIMWTKNIELGIEAFARFRQQHPAYAHFRFVVAGYVDAKSEPYLARLRALAAPAGHIDFVVSPSDAELLRLYRSAYAIVYTPFNEDWGLTPLEGMAHGKAVVAVDRGGPRETVRDQETGFLMPASAERFAECMARLAGSPEMTERMGRAAHAHARQYDTRAFVRIIDDRLDALVPSAAGETTEAGVLTQTAG
jgi:glycosyltransferase involved in cell wall biosynthesis